MHPRNIGPGSLDVEREDRVHCVLGVDLGHELVIEPLAGEVGVETADEAGLGVVPLNVENGRQALLALSR